MKTAIGRYSDGQGYVWLYFSDGSMQREHRTVMEAATGQKLKRSDHVHHKDLNGSNNSLRNLEVKTPADHAAIHARGRTLVWLRCPACRRWFLRERRLTLLLHTERAFTACSRSCMGVANNRLRSGSETRKSIRSLNLDGHRVLTPEPSLKRVRAPIQPIFVKKGKGRKFSCKSCGCQVSYGSSFCAKCRVFPTKIQWPEDDLLISMVKKSNVNCVAKQLGVTFNAVKKRIARARSLIRKAPD